MKNKIVTIVFGVCMLCAGNLLAGTIDVDGDFSGANEWGVDVSQPGLNNPGYFDTYLPTNATRYITEDNAYGGGAPIQWVGPAYSNGNAVDAEAMYFTYDSQNIYVAVVTGLNPFISREDIGDLFIDTGKYQTSTSYAPPVLVIPDYEIHANSHVDNNYEYALHYYDLNVENYFNPSTGDLVPSLITPELYRQTSTFNLEGDFPGGLAGDPVTGEPTGLGDDLRLTTQPQCAFADPWAIHYTNYMDWMDDINAGILNPENLNKALSPILTGGALDFDVLAIPNSEHFLYEFQIPISAIGWDPSNPLWIHWTMECGNDELDLIYAPPVIPEPGTLTLLGLGLLGIGAARRKRSV